MPSNAHHEPVTPVREVHAPATGTAAGLCMSLEVALDLALCGVLLAGLSFLAHHLDAGFPRLTFAAAVGGGALCVLWAILGRYGTRGCRLGAMVTLALVACLLALQAVRSWGTSAEGGGRSRLVAALMTVLVVFSVGMLASLVRERKDVPP
jgi:hypothetical protein